MKIMPAILSCIAVCLFALAGCADGQTSSVTSPSQKMETNDTTRKIIRTDEEWRKLLSPEAYYITREKGTERAFTGAYYKTKDAGRYACIACGQELFTSDDKYDSGCGWPSFTAPARAEVIDEETDRSHGMVRTEVMCSRCGAHLGHVFTDGPRERGGLRYCINSGALDFRPQDTPAE